jgi:hypothetical protein
MNTLLLVPPSTADMCGTRRPNTTIMMMVSFKIRTQYDQWLRVIVIVFVRSAPAF